MSVPEPAAPEHLPLVVVVDLVPRPKPTLASAVGPYRSSSNNSTAAMPVLSLHRNRLATYDKALA